MEQTPFGLFHISPIVTLRSIGHEFPRKQNAHKMAPSHFLKIVIDVCAKDRNDRSLSSVEEQAGI